MRESLKQNTRLYGRAGEMMTGGVEDLEKRKDWGVEGDGERDRVMVCGDGTDGGTCVVEIYSYSSDRG